MVPDTSQHGRWSDGFDWGDAEADGSIIAGDGGAAIHEFESALEECTNLTDKADRLLQVARSERQ